MNLVDKTCGLVTFVEKGARNTGYIKVTKQLPRMLKNDCIAELATSTKAEHSKLCGEMFAKSLGEAVMISLRFQRFINLCVNGFKFSVKLTHV